MSEQTFTGTLGDKEWRVRLEMDQDAESPRSDETNSWTLVGAHRKYTLGDQQISSRDEMEGLLADAGLNRTTALVVPIYMLDHSSLAFSTTDFNDKWDSGQLGEAFISRDKITKYFEGNEEKAIEGLKSELATYQDYVTGEVYGIVYETRAAVNPKRDPDDDVTGWKTEESCWGYYGEDNAKKMIKDLVPAEVNAVINPPATPAVPATTARRRGP